MTMISLALSDDSDEFTYYDNLAGVVATEKIHTKTTGNIPETNNNRIKEAEGELKNMDFKDTNSKNEKVVFTQSKIAQETDFNLEDRFSHEGETHPNAKESIVVNENIKLNENEQKIYEKIKNEKSEYNKNELKNSSRAKAQMVEATINNKSKAFQQMKIPFDININNFPYPFNSTVNIPDQYNLESEVYYENFGIPEINININHFHPKNSAWFKLHNFLGEAMKEDTHNQLMNNKSKKSKVRTENESKSSEKTKTWKHDIVSQHNKRKMREKTEDRTDGSNKNSLHHKISSGLTSAKLIKNTFGGGIGRKMEKSTI